MEHVLGPCKRLLSGYLVPRGRLDLPSICTGAFVFLVTAYSASLFLRQTVCPRRGESPPPPLCVPSTWPSTAMRWELEMFLGTMNRG